MLLLLTKATIQQKKTCKDGWCWVKLDMHKAYDRIEWAFLKAILLKLGFNANWVQMIMLCVSSVEYRVRYNSTETEAFKPTRGLRQGGGSSLAVSISPLYGRHHCLIIQGQTRR